MNLHQLFLTKNQCYITGKKITPVGIMVHSTGANNPSIGRYVGPDDGLLGSSSNNWNVAKPDGREVCVHAFIGKLKDGSIATYQTLPWDMRGWHAGGKANDTHIGFEICEDALTDADYLNKVYTEAVELCVTLCKQYNIKPESPSLICHSEGYKLGLASNHADVMHWFPKFNKSMDTFRADVAKGLAAPAQAAGASANTQDTKDRETTVDNAVADGVITDKAYWLSVLNGTTVPDKTYIKTLLDNTHKAIQKNAAK
jgi:N-acetylmuramoyl-L-alanine amidase CwlA